MASVPRVSGCYNFQTTVPISNNVPKLEDSNRDDLAALLAQMQRVRKIPRGTSNQGEEEKSIDADKIIMRVYLGGAQGKHEMTFRAAVKELCLLERGVQIEYLTAKDVRERISKKVRRLQNKPEWSSPARLLNWLDDAHIPVVLCQNIYLGFYGLWDIEECLSNLHHLASKPAAFPLGKEWHCPVLNSDKFKYLNLLRDRVNPTLQVPLHFFKNKTIATFVCDEEFIQFMKVARKFMKMYNEEDGWLLKAPFVEHQIGFKNQPIHHVQDLIKWLLSTMKASSAFHKPGTLT